MPFTMDDWGGDDIIDSREIIEYHDDLESDRDALVEALTEAKDALAEHRADPDSNPENEEHLENDYIEARDALTSWDEEHGADFAAVKEIVRQASGYGDWEYGETLIRDRYFEEYAQDLASDIGALDKADRWPLTHIDWSAAAKELAQDYTEIDVGGFTYLMRA